MMLSGPFLWYAFPRVRDLTAEAPKTEFMEYKNAPRREKILCDQTYVANLVQEEYLTNSSASDDSSTVKD